MINILTKATDTGDTSKSTSVCSEQKYLGIGDKYKGQATRNNTSQQEKCWCRKLFLTVCAIQSTHKRLRDVGNPDDCTELLLSHLNLRTLSSKSKPTLTCLLAKRPSHREHVVQKSSCLCAFPVTVPPCQIILTLSRHANLISCNSHNIQSHE